MMAYAVQTIKNREIGLENMRKQGVHLPETETQIAYVPFYHASKRSRLPDRKEVH